MQKYERLTKRAGWHKDIDLKDELGYSYIYQRLAELENSIDDGDLIFLPCIRKVNIGGVDCVEYVYVQHNGTIGECVCKDEREIELLKNIKNA